MTVLAAILLAQCCGGGSSVSTGEYTQVIILAVFVALLLLVRLIWKKKGVSTMNKLGKIAVVIILAVVVVVVVMKKNNAAAPPGQPTTQTAGIPRLVDLGSTTCIPCKMMAPILDDLKKEFVGKLQVDFIDVNVNEEAGKPYNIKLIPTQVFFDASGKELWRHEGFFSKEDILAKWKELGVALTAPVGAANAPPADAPAVKSGST